MSLAVYLSCVTLGGGAVLWLLHSYLVRAEQLRRAHLKEKETFDAIKTESPVDKPVASARAASLRSVADRFTVLRRLVLLVMVGLWLLALAFPFLNQTPKVVISFLIGAFTLVLGIGLKPVLENVAAGVVLSMSNCVNTGDTVVIDGKYGFVEDITLFHTVVKVWNWQRYVIPNSSMLTKEYLNYTLNDAEQWVHIEFHIEPGADLSLVSETAIETAAASSYAAGYEQPKFWVMELGKDSIRCWLAAWATSPPEAWLLRSTVQAALATRYAKLGIRFHCHHVQGLPGEGSQA